MLGKRTMAVEEERETVGDPHLYVDTSSGPAYRPNSSTQQMQRAFGIQKQEMLSLFEETASEIAFHGKVQINEHKCTPMERYLQFAEVTTHQHTITKTPLELDRALLLQHAHPERWVNPKATLTSEHRCTLDHLPAKRSLERYLAPRRCFPNPSPRAGEDMDVSRYLTRLRENTCLSLYGLWFPPHDLLGERVMVCVVRLDGVSRHFAALVFTNMRYITETGDERQQQEEDQLLPGLPPDNPLRGQPLYHYYFVCKCKRPPR